MKLETLLRYGTRGFKMAHGKGKQHAADIGGGALGGAVAGAAAGSLFPGAGTAIGAGVGALAGGLGGFFAGEADRKAQEEMQAALEQAEAERLAALEAAEKEYEEAQEEYDRNVMQSSAAAREALKTTMAAKAAQDAVVKESAIDDAARTADSAGLIGAEKADFLAKSRADIEAKTAASSPAVFAQALGGARSEQAAGERQAAFGLQQAGSEYNTKTQLAQGKYGADVTQISGQQLPQNRAALGQALGSVAQAALIAKGAGVEFGKEAAATPSPDISITEIKEPLQVEKVGWDVDEQGNVIDTASSAAASSAAAPSAAAPTGLGGRRQAPSVAQSRTAALGGTPDTGGTYLGPEQGPYLGPELPPALAPQGSQPIRPDASQPTLSTQGSQLYNPVPAGPAYLGPEPPPPLAPQGSQPFNPVTPIEPPPNLGETPIDLYGESSTLTEEQIRAGWGLHPSVSYASGGLAGTQGPEVAVLGEEGPELVLNAAQTANLTQALGAQQAAAEQGLGQMSAEELEAYLQELLNRSEAM